MLLEKAPISRTAKKHVFVPGIVSLSLAWAFSSSYVIPCLVLSVLLNVPKYFESRFVWREVNRTAFDPEANETKYEVEEVSSGPSRRKAPVELPQYFQAASRGAKCRLDFDTADFCRFSGWACPASGRTPTTSASTSTGPGSSPPASSPWAPLSSSTGTSSGTHTDFLLNLVKVLILKIKASLEQITPKTKWTHMKRNDEKTAGNSLFLARNVAPAASRSPSSRPLLWGLRNPQVPP